MAEFYSEGLGYSISWVSNLVNIKVVISVCLFVCLIVLMNPLTYLSPFFLAGKLGRTSGIFLSWFSNPKLSWSTYIYFQEMLGFQVSYNYYIIHGLNVWNIYNNYFSMIICRLLEALGYTGTYSPNHPFSRLVIELINLYISGRIISFLFSTVDPWLDSAWTGTRPQTHPWRLFTL